MDKDKHLMKLCFDNWNTVKKFQTKAELERDKGNINEARKYELIMYKAQAKLELSMRALQGELNKEGEKEE